MAASHKSLAHFQLTGLLRLLAGLRRTATLVAENGPWVLRVWFDQGRVVGAVRSPEVGVDALETAEYLFSSGRFVVSDGEPPPAVRLDLSPDELASRLDGYARERAELTRSVPSLCDVPRRVAEMATDLDRTSRSCLEMVDGRRTVADVIGAEQPLRRLRALASLVQLGLVEFGPDRAARLPRATSAAHPSQPTVMAEPADAVLPAHARARDRSSMA
jgi:uncharacterized protein DUF4388